VDTRSKASLLTSNPSDVTSVGVDGKKIAITGGLIRTARLAEEWYEDVEVPESIVEAIKLSKIRADIFTFWQRLPETERKYGYHMEWDHIAALPIINFNHWWEKQIKSRTRNLITNAEKKGVIAREAKFDDEFVQGMAEIFNETPVRQGRPFWHYGKDFQTVKQEFSRYLYRETLIGVYFDDKLIGFIMLADADRYAITGQIISKVEHRDKAPNNVLIAKAVEICSAKKIPYLVYVNWGSGSYAEFKRRNGFQKVGLPRYYVPLTPLGRVVLRLRLHRGFVGLLPENLKAYLKELRRVWYTGKRLQVAPPHENRSRRSESPLG
jgi:hypothetical protein